VIVHTAEALVDFHTAAGRDGRGRTIEDVWRLELDDLETSHDYIQWLFPLLEPSRAQPQSPVLTAGAAEILRRSPVARERLVGSAGVMARFYGFTLVPPGATWRVTPSDSFQTRKSVWLRPGNHNYLRQTRILKSLTLLGLRPLAAAWLECLGGVYRSHPPLIAGETFEYWRAAVG
jgi:hypothetical protein